MTMKNNRYNKTEMILLQRMMENRYSVGSTTYGFCGGQGPEGGRIRYGHREFDAMIKLRDKGLVTLSGMSESSETRRGFTVRFYNGVATITDEGRKVYASVFNQEKP